jgi:gas vesicle protein
MPSTREQIKVKILQWRDEIEPSMAKIRRSQDELLLDIAPEDMPYAMAAMTNILGRGGLFVSNVNNTTNIGNAGVAVTGGEVRGNVTGTAHDNVAALQNDPSENLRKLKEAIRNAEDLKPEQKEQAEVAADDLEAEAKKPEGSRSMGRVRNAFKVLGELAGVAKGVEFVYKDVLPHLHTFFRLAQ